MISALEKVNRDIYDYISTSKGGPMECKEWITEFTYLPDDAAMTISEGIMQRGANEVISTYR